MKVLIGGGTGFVGKRLVSKLTSRGHEVVVISRRNAPGQLTWLDIESAGLPENTGAVVNLAGQLLMDPLHRWNDNFKETLRNSRIETTSILARAIEEAKRPPSVFVGSSAVGYYPTSQTKQYTEDSVCPPSDFLSQLTVDWEAASELSPSCPTRRVVVRIGVVLGRDGGVIQNLIIPFWLGLGGRISSGSQWFPWVHVEDVAGIIMHAIENKKVEGVLNATAPIIITNSEFTTAFAKALWRPACFPVPKVVLKFVFGEERAKVMTEGQRVLPRRTLESGYEFKYPNIASACKEFSHIAKKMTW